MAAAAASGQPDTTIEHVDYRNKLNDIRNIYHQVNGAKGRSAVVGHKPPDQEIVDLNPLGSGLSFSFSLSR